MAEAKVEPEMRKFILILIIKHGKNDLFFAHKTVVVLGGKIGEVSKQWHSHDITSLPRSIEIVVPEEIVNDIYVVIALENKFNGVVEYSSDKYNLTLKYMNKKVKTVELTSRHRIFDIYRILFASF